MGPTNSSIHGDRRFCASLRPRHTVHPEHNRNVARKRAPTFSTDFTD